MITCKIAIDFDEPNADFNEFFDKLGAVGDMKTESYLSAIFFSSVDPSIKRDFVDKALLECGFKQAFVKEYNEKNMPSHESDDVKSWLLNHLVKQSYQQYIVDNSDKLRKFCKDAKKLDAQIVADTAKRIKDGGAKNEQNNKK